jgi:hypothetical protein
MIIRGKRINNIYKYIKREEIGDIKLLRVKIENDIKKKAIDIGFSNELQVGELIIPRVIGPITYFNAYGKEVINKREKENRDIYRPYHIKDWHGQYHDGIAHEIRNCYKREHINPYETELMIIQQNENKYIINKNIIRDAEELKHIMNLLLEIFEEFEILYNEEKINYGEIKRLNWDILPKGKYPWEKLYPYIKKNLDNMQDIKAKIAKENIEKIVKYNPKFVAIGKAGFSGYIIYGFNNENKVILESMEINNATYVLNENWENISKLTKAEILKSNLHERRIIHTKNWNREIEKVIEKML